jgi:hypothetical protein
MQTQTPSSPWLVSDIVIAVLLVVALVVCFILYPEAP